MDKRLDVCCNEKEEFKISEYKDLQNKRIMAF